MVLFSDVLADVANVWL